MDLLIKIDENGLPQRHPRLRSNLQLAYPDGGFEGSNVPSGWIKFKCTSLKLFSKLIGISKTLRLFYQV